MKECEFLSALLFFSSVLDTSIVKASHSNLKFIFILGQGLFPEAVYTK